jgi:hypothetical protein
VIGLQLERMIRGFFKVNVLAMLLYAVQQDARVQLVHPYSPLPLKIYAACKVAVVYPLFLYTNFSGYIDLVIAIARLMRAGLLSIETDEGPVLASRYTRAVYVGVLGLAIVVTTVLLNQPAPDIVYKAF